MKISKADLVPKDTNLREAYASFSELEAACMEFREKVNTRAHRITRCDVQARWSRSCDETI
ncbi:hypothetical protein GCM10027596_12260 [Nocardioides korecus]